MAKPSIVTCQPPLWRHIDQIWRPTRYFVSPIFQHSVAVSGVMLPYVVVKGVSHNQTHPTQRNEHYYLKSLYDVT